ncbi:MAG TPA: hypothetical protein VMH86_07755 [Rhizomicrobium sp.]|nr:hypothetical protein [Rhizomicrobium sp.]
MSATGQEEASPLDTALPEHPARRDALGNFCFYFHFLMMGYIVLGWTAPWRSALIFYLAFLPGVIGQWQLNRNTCVLNNLESLLRTGAWRNPGNREEGAWLHTIVTDATGIAITKFQLDVVMYAVMASIWGLGWWHLAGWRI